jgi:transposase-like protein
VEIAVFTGPEVFVAHRNARLTFYGRRLLVERIRGQGQAVAHVAKAMGVSRQCAHRWVARFDAEGEAGLEERSSRPLRMPSRTPATIEQAVLQLGSSLAEVRTG